MVAVNKIDKEGAQPDRVRTEMTQLGLQPEEWGGDTMFVDVSAKTRQGLDDLLEGHPLVADLEELKANPDAEASGTVIESKLDPGRGAVVDRARAARHAEDRRRDRRRRPLGPRPRDVTTTRASASRRPARPSPSRCSASTRVPEAGEFAARRRERPQGPFAGR